MKKLTKLIPYLPVTLLALFAAYAVFNTVMNNAYQNGETFYDSAEFATVIWHSGLTLSMGPTFGGSIFTTHASTINYIPDLFSYLWPGGHMSYYGFVYALVYAGTMIATYMVLLPLFSGPLRTVLAALGAFLLFCGQPMYEGSWELRSDFVAPLCLIMAFRYWQLRRYRPCVIWFILNAMVREDLGLMVLCPMGLLVGVQYLRLRHVDIALAREKRGWGIRICLISLVWALVTIFIQKHFFSNYDLVQAQYYNWAHPFEHITSALMNYRFYYMFHHAVGIWLPLFIMAVAALLFKDWEMMIGAVAYLPYIVGMLFSKNEMSSNLGSYKSFILVICVVWPALMALDKPKAMQKHYAIIQMLVLACGMMYLRPNNIEGALMRWLPQPLTHNADLYREFGENQLPLEQPFSGSVRASHGILSLYPYSFPKYWKCWVNSVKPDDQDKVQTLIWFQNDGDRRLVEKILQTGTFDITIIQGTKIRVAHRMGPPIAPVLPKNLGN